MFKLQRSRQAILMVLFGVVLISLIGACQSATPTPTATPAAPTVTSAAATPTVQPQPTPQVVATVLPPPDVAELQRTLAERSIELKALRSEFETYKKEQALELRNVLALITMWSATAAFVAGIFAFYGLRTRKEIKDTQAQIKQQIQVDLEQAEKDFRTALDKKLYNLDPASHPIRVRIGHPALDMLVERVRLTTSGFKVDDCTKIGDECKNGITIVPINDADDERQFMEAIQATSFDSKRAAFILYTPAYRIQPQTMKAYGNLAIANMPTTLVSAILAVARGLEPDKPSEPIAAS